VPDVVIEFVEPLSPPHPIHPAPSSSEVIATAPSLILMLNRVCRSIPRSSRSDQIQVNTVSSHGLAIAFQRFSHPAWVLVYQPTQREAQEVTDG
jgi:hypothetical protein